MVRDSYYKHCNITSIEIDQLVAVKKTQVQENQKADSQEISLDRKEISRV